MAPCGWGRPRWQGDVALAPADGERPTSGGVPAGPRPRASRASRPSPSQPEYTEAALAYDHLPPAGGDHFPVPSTCGFYSSNPPRPSWSCTTSSTVRSGHRPDLDDAELGALRELAAQETKLIATPFEDMDSPLTVTAWGRQMPLDSVDDPRLRQFIDTYRDGPAALGAGNACQGVGDPEVPAPSA